MENTNVVTEEIKNEVEKPVIETVAVNEKKGFHPIQAIKDKKEKFVENHPVAAARIEKGARITGNVISFAAGVGLAVLAVKAINGDNGDNSENPETAESDEIIIDGEYTVTEQEETEANASENVVES